MLSDKNDHGSELGVEVGQRTIPWNNIGVLLQNSPVKYHIFESCYSGVLEHINSNLNIHGMEGSIDTELAYLDTLVYLIDVFQESITISNGLKALLASILAVLSILQIRRRINFE